MTCKFKESSVSIMAGAAALSDAAAFLAHKTDEVQWSVGVRCDACTGRMCTCPSKFVCLSSLPTLYRVCVYRCVRVRNSKGWGRGETGKEVGREVMEWGRRSGKDRKE